MDSSPVARLNRAFNSLEGLSVGDAFGEQFFMSFEMVTRLLDKSEQWEGPPYSFEDDFIQRELISKRRLEFCAPTWRWTDDTALAIEVVAELRNNGEIHPDSLAERFTKNRSECPAACGGDERAQQRSCWVRVEDIEWNYGISSWLPQRV